MVLRMPTVGDDLKADNANWNFGSEVVENFDSHASRSIPLYSEGHDLIANLSDFFVSSNSVCYEIGCSTGTLTYKLASHNSDKTGSRFIGIDIEKEIENKFFFKDFMSKKPDQTLKNAIQEV